MNRELKFRVWFPTSKSFVFYMMLDENGDTMGMSDLDRDIHYDKDDYNSVVVQQSTGLKDKNNKEIYEGDIIKVAEDCYAFFDENVLLVVEWENHGFLCFDNLLARDTIVVGNIFENPNLING